MFQEELYSNLSNQKLQARLANGRKWLRTHCQSACKRRGNAYDHEAYSIALQLYEDLAEEAYRRGLYE